MAPLPSHSAALIAGLLALGACGGRNAVAPSASGSPGFVLALQLRSFVEQVDVPRVDVEVVAPAAAPAKAHFQTDPRAHGFDRFEMADWYHGPGTYRLRLSYPRRLLFAERALEAEFFIAGTEEGVEATFSLDVPRANQESLRIDVLVPAPPELRADVAWTPSSDGAGRYQIHNRSAVAVCSSRAPILERRTAAGWQLVRAQERGTVCSLDRPEQRVAPGGSTRAEEWVDHCGLRPLDAGQYRHTVRLWAESGEARSCEESGQSVAVRQVWMLHHPFEVRKGLSDLSVRMKHAFTDVPMDSLRLGSHMSVSGSFTAEVVDGAGKASCVCEGAAVGKEGWRTTGLAGECLYLAGPDVDERTCIPRKPDLRGDPVLVPPSKPDEFLELR